MNMSKEAKKWIGGAVVVLVIFGGLFYLLFGQMEKNLVYFVTPTELLAKGDAALNQPVRLGGMVKSGSLLWDSSIPELRFELTDGGHDIRILSHSTPPQMFQEKMGVVVEGRLLANGNFDAERLMVKHSNEYRPPAEGEKPALIYHELTTK